MQKYSKMDKMQIAQTNKYNVLRCLIKEGPINRAAIAKRTDLSIPTIMTITDDLLENTVVRSIGKGESSGGKRPEMLEIIPERFYYIGVDIGRTAVRVVAINAVGEQIVSLQEPTGDPFPEKEFTSRLSSLVLQVSEKLEANKENIMGVGIAMPGLIEYETGNVLFSPDFGWRDVPLQEWLQEMLPFTVLVENANRALALNESYTTGDDEISSVAPANMIAQHRLAAKPGFLEQRDRAALVGCHPRGQLGRTAFARDRHGRLEQRAPQPLAAHRGRDQHAQFSDMRRPAQRIDDDSSRPDDHVVAPRDQAVDLASAEGVGPRLDHTCVLQVAAQEQQIVLGQRLREFGDRDGVSACERADADPATAAVDGGGHGVVVMCCAPPASGRSAATGA